MSLYPLASSGAHSLCCVLVSCVGQAPGGLLRLGLIEQTQQEGVSCVVHACFACNTYSSQTLVIRK